VATLDMRFDALRTVPFIATTLAFVLFFKLIPYRPVPLKHALIGAVTASTLFELAKRAFAYYVTNFPTQQAVYGAFATLPIFLLWIYLSWLIVLLGAEITQCLTTYNVVSTRRRTDLFDNPIFAAYRALTHLYHAQHDGRALTDKELFRFERQLGYEALNSSLERLAAANWISRNDAFEWILSRDLNRTTLVDLMRVVPTTAPTDNVAELSLDRSDERFMAALMNHAQWLDAELAIPIAALIGENIEAAQPK
jgi:membrane protein